MIKDYRTDGVIPPTHVGHKDQVASLRLGVAFLDMGTVDIFDPRFTTMDEIKERLRRYFTAMGLG
ncbi:MAG: hypothetical protein ISS53_00830 [Dehalococcoidia bacterium]|nr:hypothetical protein [Dehalococcoidia bacterium]